MFVSLGGLNLLIPYFFLVSLLGVVAVVAISSFWRYRFIGDRTAQVVILFSFSFFLIVLGTLALLNYTALTDSGIVPGSSSTNFEFFDF
jgi:hypothetical protein